MASKKDFSQVNTGRVYSAITEATAGPEQITEQPKARRKPRKVYTTAEIEQMQAEGKTQGRKGCKAIRINMAFSTEIHDYIRIMSKHLGMSVTEFTNFVFKQSMELNAKEYEEIKEGRREFFL